MNVGVSNKCNGCMACVSVCPQKCITIHDELDVLNIEVEETKCINCQLCRKVCPNISRTTKERPIEWRQGWADERIRADSTSGGAASAIIKSFINEGGYVAACLFKDGEFVFDITNDEEYSKKFSGSKYVKSNPEGIYSKVKKQLKTSKVLFIGLPCQVAALKNYVKERDNLYTIDLICHGTPSAKLLEAYLAEKGYDLHKIEDIKFRKKNDMGIMINGEKIYSQRVADEYLCTFLEAVSYTENCYSCDFATLDRVSDITLGDSWGSEYKDQVNKGISLILIQTEKGQELAELANLEMRAVDLENAIKNNHQLSYPSVMSSKRSKFFNLIKSGKTYKKATFYVLPKMQLKQYIKRFLIFLHIMK